MQKLDFCISIFILEFCTYVFPFIEINIFFLQQPALFFALESTTVSSHIRIHVAARDVFSVNHHPILRFQVMGVVMLETLPGKKRPVLRARKDAPVSCNCLRFSGRRSCSVCIGFTFRLCAQQTVRSGIYFK